MPLSSAEANAVLRAGETCWRIARADRMSVIIDAAAYFTHLKQAILSARHTIMMIGWDFDTRVELDRDKPDPALPNRLGQILVHAIHHNPAINVYLLRWDLSFLKMPSRGTTPAFIIAAMIHRRLHFKLDSHHPIEGCHHQKIVVIDDSIAFCGGIDVTSDRWDTPHHYDHDPRRQRPHGQPHGPWHDATTAVDGAAARALATLARDRWQAATGKRPARPAHHHDCWPTGLVPTFHDVDIAIARTEPAYEEQPEIREIEALYLAAIASARRTIYLESQYFSAQRIAEAVARRLHEPDGPEVVIINPRHAGGWLEDEVMSAARSLLLETLRQADHHNRLRCYTPVTEGGLDIYVHAKILAIDDTLLRIGSSNINNRSLGLDTECDLAVEAASPAESRAIHEVRDALLAEHLSVTRQRLDDTLRDNGGSLIRTLDQLAGQPGKTLVPLHPAPLSAFERDLAESHVLDPLKPETMDQTFSRMMRIIAPAKFLAVAAAGTALFATAAWAVASQRNRPPR